MGDRVTAIQAFQPNRHDPLGRHSRCAETVPLDSFVMIYFSGQTESELLLEKFFTHLHLQWTSAAPLRVIMLILRYLSDRFPYRVLLPANDKTTDGKRGKTTHLPNCFEPARVQRAFC